MAMLEHDATLHTRHGIERLMYRGRLVDTVLKQSRTPPRSPAAPSARAAKSACSGDHARRELRVTRVSHK